MFEKPTISPYTTIREVDGPIFIGKRDSVKPPYTTIKSVDGPMFITGQQDDLITDNKHTVPTPTPPPRPRDLSLDVYKPQILPYTPPPSPTKKKD